MLIRQNAEEKDPGPAVNANNIGRTIFFAVLSGVGLGLGFLFVNKIFKTDVRLKR